ncbi:MAG: CPBP family intramembrane metalloprotease [Polyangiaceae bacterium]|nr:CPBP family intramembrane metalloprotease [Polyangiaceae bacterium]
MHLSPRAEGYTRVARAVVASILVLALTRFGPSFHSLGPHGGLFGRLLYLTLLTAGLPAVAVLYKTTLRPAGCGLGAGDSLRYQKWIVSAAVLAVGGGFVASRFQGMRDYYPIYRAVLDHPMLWVPSTVAFSAYGLAWEGMFRGALLLGTQDVVGKSGALILQTLLFAAGHWDKPPLELLLSVPAGLFFGVVALKTKSILPGFLIHATLSLSVNLFCAYG